MRIIKHLFLMTVVSLLSFTASMAQKTITGTITDAETNDGLVGAAVQVKGTSKGAIADASGNYSIEVPDNATVLVFSFVGYTSKEVAIGLSTQINIVLGTGLELNNVVVIGSRNQTRTKIESPVPVDVIPLQNVVNEVGQVDINQILTFIAPSFQSARQAISDGTDHVDPAQLRGLGPDQVLVLVNGKRRHQSALVNANGTVNRGSVGTDMNAIPATSVDRIEILRDGAAAQYGSDAIAGVINIVLKKSTGLSVNLSTGVHTTSYAKNYAAKRLLTDFAGDENVSVTDGNTIQAGVNYGFKIGEKGFLNITGEYVSRGRTNRSGTYTGGIWAPAAKSDSINKAKGLTRNDFDMLIGNSEVKGGGVVVNFEYPLNDNLDLYAFGGYNNKKGNAAGFYRYPGNSNGSDLARNTNTFWTRPGGGFDKTIAIYPNGFLPEINSDVTDIAGTFGLRGKVKDWNWDLSQTFGKNDFAFGVANSVNYSQAADTSGRFSKLQTTFDAGSSNFTQLTTNFDITKNHKVLKGLNTALGAEYRIDNYEIVAGDEASYTNYNKNSLAAAGAQVFAGFLPSNASSNSRNNIAFYSDNELDITEKWLVSAALRFENYSDFGSTFNYKIASRYKISDAFTIRASHSTGFRAPSQQQKFYSKTGTVFVSEGGTLVPKESGIFTNTSGIATLLGIPELKQETSKSYTVGVAARIAEGLDLTVDAYQIDIKNRIILTNNFNASQFTDVALKDQITKAGATVASVFTNAVDTRNQGIEAVLSYTKSLGDNSDIRFTLAGSFIKNNVLDSADVVSGSTVKKPFIKTTSVLLNNGQVGNYFNREDESRMEVASPVDKFNGTVNYRIGKFSAMFRAVRFGKVVYLDPTITSEAAFVDNAFNSSTDKETLDQTFNPKWVIDLTATYEIIKGLKVTLGANNLFDTYQDLHTHSANFGAGRFVYSRRVQQMGFNGRYVFGRLVFNLK
jgi:iron complex outermembrane recepter protein